MSVIVEVIIPAADFALGHSLQSTSNDARFELERMIPTTDRIVPYFWVYDADVAALEAALSNHDDVLTVTLLDEYDDRALFRIEWPAEIDGLLQILNAHDAAILEAIGTNDRWEFQFRFPDSADIAAFRADCDEAGVSLDLQQLYNPTEPGVETPGLTPVQHETLLTALEEGYFAIPRRITTEELADKLNVSDQAASERLRRGQTTILSSLLLDDDSDEPQPGPDTDSV